MYSCIDKYLYIYCRSLCPNSRASSNREMGCDRGSNGDMECDRAVDHVLLTVPVDPLYEDPRTEVRRLLDKYHCNRYKVYNFASELAQMTPPTHRMDTRVERCGTQFFVDTPRTFVLSKAAAAAAKPRSTAVACALAGPFFSAWRDWEGIL